jgi:hypothetical protein
VVGHGKTDVWRWLESGGDWTPVYIRSQITHTLYELSSVLGFTLRPTSCKCEGTCLSVRWTWYGRVSYVDQ